MKVPIFTSPYRYCRAIAVSRAKGHIAKGSKTGPEDEQKRIRMEVRSTVCEFAFSLLHPSVRQQFRGDVNLKGDGGWDYQLPNGRRIDVKSGPPRTDGMIVGLRHLTACDTFVMSRYLDDERCVEFLGWINAREVEGVGETISLKEWGKKPHVRVALDKLHPMSEFKWD